MEKTREQLLRSGPNFTKQSMPIVVNFFEAMKELGYDFALVWGNEKNGLSTFSTKTNKADVEQMLRSELSRLMLEE